LDDNYRITSDDGARNWVLQRLRGERDEDEMADDDARPARPEHLKGQELWLDKGYYVSVEGALRAWATVSARTSSEPLPKAIVLACKRLSKLLSEIRDATGEV
jgi:hypothetical protein